MNLAENYLQTVTGCLAVQMIACRPVDMLNVAGTPPALYQSGDARNAALIAERTQTNPPL